MLQNCHESHCINVFGSGTSFGFIYFIVLVDIIIKHILLTLIYYTKTIVYRLTVDHYYTRSVCY